MRVRFVKTTPSQLPDFPFQTGQIIVVAQLTAEVRQWVDEGAAVLLDEPEAAVLAAASTASERRPKARGVR